MSFQKIRLVLVDDSELVRVGLRTLLGAQSNLSIVAEAASNAQALSTCREMQPDLILLDIRLPDGNSTAHCGELRKACPNSKILFLTSVIDDAIIAAAIQAGAHGYLLKEINGNALIQAINEIHAGKSIIDPSVAARVMNLARTAQTKSPLKDLSPQEQKVIALLAQGLTNKEIGNQLGLTEKTVKNYLANMFDKLGINRRSQAVALYIRTHEPAPGR